MFLSEADKQKIIKICKRNDISSCALFGSFSRGEANENSDIDLLVKFSKPVGYAFFAFALELEEALGRKVDLATDPMIGPHLRPYVMADLMTIYEETERPVAAPAYS
ncbi:MAG TPA: nucleotidyltransferase family protein [Pyrinomonadaceae bacterium]|nr:nucleotidyltransferase family protein [Pyrinomonadaceae bacterium]